MTDDDELPKDRSDTLRRRAVAQSRHDGDPRCSMSLSSTPFDDDNAKQRRRRVAPVRPHQWPRLSWLVLGVSLFVFYRSTLYPWRWPWSSDLLSWPDEHLARHRPRVQFPHALATTVVDLDQLHEWFGPAGPDFGGLDLDTLRYMPQHFYRVVLEDDAEWYQHDRASLLSKMNKPMAEEYEHVDELDQPRDCQRLAWTESMYPTCSVFHQLTLDRQPSLLQPFQRRYLAHGFFRDAWMLAGAQDKVVLKTPRLDPEADLRFSYAFFSHMAKEALVMERTSASDRTMDIYGHCAFSMLVEVGYEISQRISSGVEYDGRGRITDEELDAIQVDGVVSFNNFSAEEKLDVALAMAEGLAVLHGHDEGVILLDDVHPDQWLVNRHGLVKLNDFNNAHFLEWNPEQERYCKLDVWIGGDYRSPEEVRGDWIDEKADVWPMGNNLFALLTGLFPYYDIWDKHEIEEIVARNAPPYLDPRWKTRNYIEGRLTEIMEPCFRPRPEDRISIFQVVQHLRETKAVAQELKAKGEADWEMRPAGILPPNFDPLHDDFFAEEEEEGPYDDAYDSPDGEDRLETEKPVENDEHGGEAGDPHRLEGEAGEDAEEDGEEAEDEEHEKDGDHESGDAEEEEHSEYEEYEEGEYEEEEVTIVGESELPPELIAALQRQEQLVANAAEAARQVATDSIQHGSDSAAEDSAAEQVDEEDDDTPSPTAPYDDHVEDERGRRKQGPRRTRGHDEVSEDEDDRY